MALRTGEFSRCLSTSDTTITRLRRESHDCACKCARDRYAARRLQDAKAMRAQRHPDGRGLRTGRDGNATAMKVFQMRRELSRGAGVISARCASGRALHTAAADATNLSRAANRFSSRSRPATPAEIPEGFSSSLLPPSFLRGRSATFLLPSRAASGGSRPATFDTVEPPQ